MRHSNIAAGWLHRTFPPRSRRGGQRAAGRERRAQTLDTEAGAWDIRPQGSGVGHGPSTPAPLDTPPPRCGCVGAACPGGSSELALTRGHIHLHFGCGGGRARVLVLLLGHLRDRGSVLIAGLLTLGVPLVLGRCKPGGMTALLRGPASRVPRIGQGGTGVRGGDIYIESGRGRA